LAVGALEGVLRHGAHAVKATNAAFYFFGMTGFHFSDPIGVNKETAGRADKVLCSIFKLPLRLGGRTHEVCRNYGYAYYALYLAIGAQQSAPLGIKGEELDGVYGGVDFMRAVNLGKPPISGGHVAVIGGGNVAMDVCRTAVRLGAEKTTVIYRRDRSDMPADPDEVAEAEAEGVEFLFLSAPTEFIERDGRVCGVKAEIMETGETGENGKRNIVCTGRYMDMEADCVICAVGQTIDWGSLDTGALEKGKKGKNNRLIWRKKNDFNSNLQIADRLMQKDCRGALRRTSYTCKANEVSYSR